MLGNVLFLSLSFVLYILSNVVNSLEYEDSDSSDETDSKTSRIGRRRKKQSTRVPPPLPGFGNPAFEDDNAPTGNNVFYVPLEMQSDVGEDSTLLTCTYVILLEPALMTRLVERLQEMAAPPPPIAMQAAYRQQEQRRQKLFVGEYSMRDESMDELKRPKEGSIILMGTNPFRRTTRTVGVAAGGWSEKAPDSSSRRDEAVSRMFPLYRTGVGSIRFRNSTSESVYSLAQHLQTNVVRSKLSSSKETTKNIGSASTGSLWDAPTASSGEEVNENQPFMIWGKASDLCRIVLDGLEQERMAEMIAEERSNEKTSGVPSVNVITGLLRDLIDWIEHEDWERRLVRHFLR